MFPRIPWKTMVSLLFATVLLSVTSCQSDGPFERAGETMDEAVEDAGDKMSE